jgi:hypothetical protein
VTPKDCEDNQYTVEEGSSLKADCLNCPPGHIPLDDKSACQVCQDGYYASGGNCLKETEQLRESTIGSVFKNKGTPLYILAMLVIAIALLSVMTYYSKAQSVALLQQPMLSHIAKFCVSYAGVISEFILIAGVLDSGVQKLYAYGVLMLLSRTVVASPPGIILMWAVFIQQDKVDPTTQQRTLKYHLDDETIHKNIKTFAVVLFLGCFEPPLLSFLPWYETPFSGSAQFPNLFLMRAVYFAKGCQLCITLIAQILVLVAQRDNTSSAIGIIIILNVVFTSANALLKGFEMFVRLGILRGVEKSDDSPVAKRASTVASTEGKSATQSGDVENGAGTEGGGQLELGSIYPEKDEIGAMDVSSSHPKDRRLSYIDNPLLTGRGITATPEEEVEETESEMAPFVRSYLREQVAHLRQELREEIREEMKGEISKQLATDQAGTRREL